ncbi:uncharacterized protein LOC127082514 [Lathyrus oleraceus]|uniref:uncharacterized protein LOC127082514 n=1 Tax=Pisum sativum TaxID=3888 RepID=UPI0021CFA5ED|nr:uncharacterized protein LOC127082514 [Pisum sativum]
MTCTEAEKVQFGTHMLTEEANDWWDNTRHRLEVAGNEITWVMFKGEFMKRIYDEDSRAQFAHYKSLREKRGKQLNHGKSYSVPVDKGKYIILNGRRTSVGGVPAPIKYSGCSGARHHANECKSDENKCFKCGKSGHLIADFKTNAPTYYNYGEPGHINTTCQKPKKAQVEGNVFALTGSHPNSSDRLVINTPANESVTTSLVCLNCPLFIYDKDFGIDLTCLPLKDMDVIMGMNELELNHIYINCYNKTLEFLAPKDKQENDFISAKELKELLKDEAKAFATFASLSMESQTTIEGLPVVYEFPEVFLDDMSEFLPKREVEFTIGTIQNVCIRFGRIEESVGRLT